MHQPYSSSTRPFSFISHRLTGAFLSVLIAGAPGTSFAAIIDDPNCSKHKLARNDDEWAGTPLGFPIVLNGLAHEHIFVSNNGHVSFGVPPSYSAFTGRERLENPMYTTIAPFYADVDTRNPDSDEVTYGQTTYAGRAAFCVNWGTVKGVGYYKIRMDRRNKFQLILVHREDRGSHDFDIIMNYDQVQWDYSHTTNRSSPWWPTWVGFTGNPQAVPGSGEIPPSGLLDGQPHALTAGSHGTPVPGRYIFEIRNGSMPAVATVSGTLFEETMSQPLPGASAQLCRADGRCVAALTDSQGRYRMRIVEQLVDGTPFTLSANPPVGPALLPLREALQVTPVVGAVLNGYDAVFKAPEYIPTGTRLEPSIVSTLGAPMVYSRNPLHLTTEGCPNGTATYTIYTGQETSGTMLATGPMTEYQYAKYEAYIAPLYPAHGWATIVMRVICPDGSVIKRSFALYIDPSGNVRNANGNPIRGARVTLYRSDYPLGPFEVVPDGSVIMSPANRTNPMYSDEQGHFGWDTLAGYYVVRAEKPGCTAVGQTSQPYTETDVLPVPPPVTDLDLRLDCGAVPPPTLSVPSSLVVEAQNVNGAVVSYEASALDAADGAVPVNCLPTSGTAFPFGTTVVTCTAMNSYGNVATKSFPVTVSDTRPPVLTLPGALATYATSAVGASVTYEASAVDAIDGALAPVCAPPSGATFAPGETAVSCEAADSHGNTARGAFPVLVTYEFGGILPPLSGSASSTFKPNQVIPVRFTLTGASAGISTLAARLFVAKVVGDTVSPEVPAVSAGGRETGNLFMPMGPTGAYQFLLSTKSMTPGSYWLHIDLGDGALHAVPITLAN